MNDVTLLRLDKGMSSWDLARGAVRDFRGVDSQLF